MKVHNGGYKMESRTKAILTIEEVRKALSNAFARVENGNSNSNGNGNGNAAGQLDMRQLVIEELKGGEFNCAFRARCGEKGYVIKFGPIEGTKVLTYENHMMRQEVRYYKLLQEAEIRTPQILFSDFTRKEFPMDYFVMEEIQSVTLQDARLTEEQSEKLLEELAKETALLHRTHSRRFGYEQNGLHDDWYHAYCAMLKNLKKDARAVKVEIPEIDMLLLYAKLSKNILKKVQASLVDFDLWAPNLFVDPQFLKGTGKGGLIWIDPERMFWGDPVAEFVAMDYDVRILADKPMLKYYNRFAEKKITGDHEEQIRFYFAEALLAVIMDVEKYYRYTEGDEGYTRNTATVKDLYQNSLNGLKEMLEK